MGIKGGRPENLVSLTTEKAREIGRKGGKRSGEVKRQKKLMSDIYARFLASEFDIIIDEEQVKHSGETLIEHAMRRIIEKGDSSSVSLMKEIREATEGSKTKVTGEDGGPVEISVIKRVIVG
jgi:general stress protein YciG